MTDGTGELDTSQNGKKRPRRGFARTVGGKPRIETHTQLRIKASKLARKFFHGAMTAIKPHDRKNDGVGFGVMFDKLTQKVSPEAREDAPASIEALHKLLIKLEQVGRVAASDNK